MAEKSTLRIAHIGITDHLILGITKAKLQNGIEKFQYGELETVCKFGWNEVDQAICDGSVDGAFILAPMAIDLFKSGQKIKLVLLGHKNGSVIIKNKSANIKKLEDFIGKTIIIPYQLSIHHMLLHQMLAKQGITAGFEGDVKLEVFAPAQIPEAIQYDEEGEIGGFIVAEPFGSQVINEGLGEEFALSKDLWNNHPCCVFIMREDTIAKKGDAVHELMQSLVKSGQFIGDNPKGAAQIGAQFLKQKVEVVERVLTQPADRIRTDELLPVLEDLDKIQNYMTDKMHIMKSKIDVEKLVDFQFANTAGAK